MDLNEIIEKSIAAKWIAGAYAKDALERAKVFNSKNVGVMINFLGEDFTEASKVEESVHTYMNLILNVKRQKLNAALSLKPTQLGLMIDYKLLENNYLKIVKYANQNGIFVWLDMEEPEYVSQTMNLYLKTLKFGNAGICIQSYLRRSERDLEQLLKKKSIIRLVKGAYKTGGDSGFSSKKDVDSSYRRLMQMLFRKSGRFMIATHDDKMIKESIALSKRYKRDVTYAMLNGIRDNYAFALAKTQKVSLYVPFGKDWMGYSIRRLREQGHATLILRSLINIK